MATAIKKYSKHFNATNLINKVFECFGRIKDHRSRSCPIPFENFLMSAFAMMHQKYDSLLGFDDERVDKIRCHNLEKLYHVKDGKVPSDTQMRAVVDLINPDDIRKPFKKLFSIIQRNGALNGFKFNCDKLKDHYLPAIPHAYTTSVTAYKKHHTQGAATAAYVLRYVIFPKNSTIYHEHTKYIRLRTLVIPRGLMKRGELLIICCPSMAPDFFILGNVAVKTASLKTKERKMKPSTII